MFEHYKNSIPRKEKVFEASSSAPINKVCGGDQPMDIEEIMAKRLEMAICSSEISSSRNELDKYLGEERESKDPHFDILKWWKLNQCRYPILAKMARDILDILAREL
ncbi:hypothetical protein QVD17_38119 [Tagetes erecta]|uniref:HAT C-terminal dimerisation domain-containing protein n=1 Tax=Tagetes erecta TaxID=13708 RepID=A0AAD8JXJ5_TARER|nr:hypothetical protein QVD17_38119 [Tagetes erecta]